MYSCFYNAERELQGTLWTEDGVVVGDDDIMAMVQDINIVEPDTLELVTPRDGERYLLALPYTFRTIYLWVQVVEAASS